ncbi:MAG: hypothetical protein MHM6MM_000900 [Cercozoa sp. M6MM]
MQPNIDALLRQQAVRRQRTLEDLRKRQSLLKVKRDAFKTRHEAQLRRRRYHFLWFRQATAGYRIAALHACLVLFSILTVTLRLAGYALHKEKFSGNIHGPVVLFWMDLVLSSVFVLDVVIRLVRLLRLRLSSRLRSYSFCIDGFVAILDIALLVYFVSDGEWSASSSELSTVPLLLMVLRLLRVYRLWRIKKSLNVVISQYRSTLAASSDDAALLVDGLNRVVNYDADTLFSIGFAFNVAYSALSSRRLGVFFLIYVLFTAGYAVLLCDTHCVASTDKQDLDDVKVCTGLCAPRISVDRGFLFGSALAFLLGNFVQQTFHRWWQVLVAFNSLAKKTVSVAVSACALVAPRTTEREASAKAKYFRGEFIRLLNLCFALVHMSLPTKNDRKDEKHEDEIEEYEGSEQPLLQSVALSNLHINGDEANSETDVEIDSTELHFDLARSPSLGETQASKQVSHLDKLRTKGLVRLDEQARLSKVEATTMPTLVHSWMTNLLAEAAQQSLIVTRQSSISVIEREISSLRAAAGDVFLYSSSHLPYVYAQLLTVMVRVHMALTCAVAGTFFGVGVASSMYFECLWGVLILLANLIVYEGLLEVHAVMRRHSHSQALDMLHDEVIGSTHAVLHESSLPAPVFQPEPAYPLYVDGNSDRDSPATYAGRAFTASE